MFRPSIQIAALTALFAGSYFALRAIPASSCHFLHYDQTVTTADGLEFCGLGAAPFVDVSRLPFGVAVQLTGDRPLAVGQATHYTLVLSTPDGRALRPSELAVTHTRKLHLLLVDGSLEDYQHIHPEPDGDDGQWSFDFTPRRPGNYQFFAEFVPSLTLRETIGTATLAVPGATQPKVARGLAPYTADGYTYTLRAPGGQAVTGTDISLELTVQRADGGAVKLEPVMGALAHLVAFDDALHGYAHLHPGVSGHEDDLRAPQLSFLFNTTKPGRYRIWAQVKLDGQERFAPFDLEVGGA